MIAAATLAAVVVSVRCDGQARSTAANIAKLPEMLRGPNPDALQWRLGTIAALA
jgi:hypothetical protein